MNKDRYTVAYKVGSSYEQVSAPTKKDAETLYSFLTKNDCRHKMLIDTVTKKAVKQETYEL